MANDTPIRFSEWTPTARDASIGYSYVTEVRGRNRKVSTPRDQWHRAKNHIAASALYSGVEEYKVWGGIGQRRWQRIVLVTQEEAETWLRAQAERNFQLRGALDQALRRRDLRLARTTDPHVPR